MLRDHTDGNVMLPGLQAQDRREAVAALVDALHAQGAVVDARGLLADVLRREAVGDTDVGLGVAIPHVRSPRVRTPHAAVATLANPLPGKGQSVNVLILLVGPENDPRSLLRLLARVVRGLRRPGAVQSLRDAADPGQLLAAFLRFDAAS